MSEYYSTSQRMPTEADGLRLMAWICGRWDVCALAYVIQESKTGVVLWSPLPCDPTPEKTACECAFDRHWGEINARGDYDSAEKATHHVAFIAGYEAAKKEQP